LRARPGRAGFEPLPRPSLRTPPGMLQQRRATSGGTSIKNKDFPPAAGGLALALLTPFASGCAGSSIRFTPEGGYPGIAAPRLGSIRLGSLAPAMPETDIDPFRGECDRIVSTVNPNDPALGKGPLPSRIWGSTACGSLPDAAAYLQESGRPVLIVPIPHSAEHD
jgi:hypothetical protein